MFLLIRFHTKQEVTSLMTKQEEQKKMDPSFTN